MRHNTHRLMAEALLRAAAEDDIAATDVFNAVFGERARAGAPLAIWRLGQAAFREVCRRDGVRMPCGDQTYTAACERAASLLREGWLPEVMPDGRP